MIIAKLGGVRWSLGVGYEEEIAPRFAAAKPALAVPGCRPNTVWVRAEYEAEIDYRAITGDGLLRHPAFKGLRPTARAIRQNGAR